MKKKVIISGVILLILLTSLGVIYLITHNIVLIIAIALGIIILSVGILILRNKRRFTKVRVDIVIDGDTAMLKFKNIYKHLKTRFIGVNCPEDTTRKEPFGKEATEYTKKHLLKRYVYIEKDSKSKDQYGRNLYYLWLDKPKKINEKELSTKLFNAMLLKNGYARLFDSNHNLKYRNYLIKFESEAKNKGVGMWALKEYEKERNKKRY